MKINEILSGQYTNRIVKDNIRRVKWKVTDDDLLWEYDGCSIIYFYDLKTLINMRFKFVD